MTFWLDAHLDPKLSPWLGSRFKIVAKPLREIGLRDADDDVLIAAARRLAPVVIISKDTGLAKKVEASGAPPQVIWLRCGNLSTLEMYTWLSTRFAEALKRVEAGEVVVEVI